MNWKRTWRLSLSIDHIKLSSYFSHSFRALPTLCSALLPATCFQLPWSAFLPPNPEGAEDRGEAHAEKLSVLAELLKRVWDWVLPQWHNVLGAAGVHPEHSFSMDWPCSLSFVCFLPSAADEPAKEENHYEEDGCNAINREGLLV